MKTRSAALVLVALMATAAACGSSSSGSSGNSSTSPSTSASTAAAAASSSSAPASSGVVTAAALTKGYEKTPTDIGVSAIGKAIPKGKTIAWLECDVPVCTTITTGLKQAVAATGWKLDTIPFKLADPQTLSSAIDQAAALKPAPAAVVINGAPQSEWSAKLPELKAKGIPVISGYVGTETNSSEVPVNIGDRSQTTVFGKMLADWTIADSGGKAKVLLLTDPELSTFADYVNGYKTEIARLCPACSVKVMNLSIADLEGNAVAGKVVSALQTNPSIKYAIFPTGDYATGVSAALKSAGISGVKIGGETAEPADLEAVKAGTENAWTGLPLVWSGWAIQDVALRLALGESVPVYGATIPKQIITSANVGTINPAVSFVGVPNFQAKFKKAWGLS